MPKLHNPLLCTIITILLLLDYYYYWTTTTGLLLLLLLLDVTVSKKPTIFTILCVFFHLNFFFRCTWLSGRTATLISRKTFTELGDGIQGLCIVSERKFLSESSEKSLPAKDGIALCPFLNKYSYRIGPGQ